MPNYFGTRVLKILGRCCTSPGSGLLALLRRGFEQIFEQNVSLKVKTLSNIHLVAQGTQKEKKANFRLTFVAQKRHCIKSILYYIIP